MNHRSSDPHQPSETETFIHQPDGKGSHSTETAKPWEKTQLDGQGTEQQRSHRPQYSSSDKRATDDTLEPTDGPPAGNHRPAPIETAPNLAPQKAPPQTMGRSPFRSTYLSGLNLSGLKLTNLSRLLLDRSQLLIEDGKGFNLLGVGHGLLASVAVLASGLTLFNPSWLQAWEQEVQTLFFQSRGAVIPPQDIVILGMDETSVVQGEVYSEDPEAYPELAPLQQWPWQRQAYAIAIDRVMEAGAKAVAVDLVFDLPSAWGEEDDHFLQYALERYPGEIVLASSFDDSQDDAGLTIQLAVPLTQLLDAGGRQGIINYPLEANDRVHRFAQVWLQRQAASDVVMESYLNSLPDSFTETFAKQTVIAAQGEVSDNAELPGVKGDQIFFYGPARTFTYESFWTVLDPQNWEVHRLQQTFRDKIVLIGPTAQLFQDHHRTPFGSMPGVEIHANAVATYLQQKAIADPLPHPLLKAGLVLVLTVVTGVGISYPRRTLPRMLLTLAGVVAWTMISYGQWSVLRWTVPTAMPLAAIALAGSGYVMTGLTQEKLRKLKLRQALKQYVSSPIVQDIISQQDDLQDLISEKEKETIGKVLDGRYKIAEVLGSGGFGQTFIAQDLRRPGHPRCVVKQLRPVSNDPQVFHLSRRLFTKEAETLERLNHNQIPKLLAYFEEAQEFYLVQELIAGHPLRYELLPKPSSELKVILILKELLGILDFIHECGVIHRDIKPTNIIRRHSDQHLVLIDFGAVKELQMPAPGEETPEQAKTVAIGTRGYIPNEQLAGSPRFNSDIYAVGIIGIQASTGISPDKLEDEPDTGELLWQPLSDHSDQLKAILHKMTRYDFNKRYQSAQEVLQDLTPLLEQYITEEESFTAQGTSLPSLTSQDEDFWDDATVEFTGSLSDSTVPWPTSMREEENEGGENGE